VKLIACGKKDPSEGEAIAEPREPARGRVEPRFVAGAALRRSLREMRITSHSPASTSPAHFPTPNRGEIRRPQGAYLVLPLAERRSPLRTAADAFTPAARFAPSIGSPRQAADPCDRPPSSGR
jgi:hypothetical protein